ncbi:enoyl-CoA hydratase/isomerase family protein [Actinocorallia populi]|uniref:enoyl-CoA hydratase/isomerase family protein n=1 Tax=Actinocorallia populi TaxID=2079200 RepID=UPI000D086CD3|nr:enoyl-CoA hydratase/isomerase family protein [Actinocorallia populi]
MNGPLLLSVADLADGAAHTRVLGPDAAPADPLIGIDLGSAPSAPVLSRAVERARSHDRLLVGVHDGTGLPEAARALSAYLDLTLVRSGRPAPRPYVGVEDPRAALRRLGEAASANPRASFVLGGVLRASAALPVAEALDVESFAYSTLLAGPEFTSWLAGRGTVDPPPAADEPVRIVRDGDTLHLTLNRPERRNAYGRLLRDALVDGLAVAESDPSVRRVLLDGAGPVFSAGGDLAEFGTAPDLTTAHLVRTRAGAALPLHRLRDRLTVRVHGRCVGAGVELPPFARTLIADPATTFRLPEVAMGLIPGAGGTVSLPRRIGRWRTLYLALTGVELHAPTALSWGLVDRLA